MRPLSRLSYTYIVEPETVMCTWNILKTQTPDDRSGVPASFRFYTAQAACMLSTRAPVVQINDASDTIRSSDSSVSVRYQTFQLHQQRQGEAPFCSSTSLETPISYSAQKEISKTETEVLPRQAPSIIPMTKHSSTKLPELHSQKDVPTHTVYSSFCHSSIAIASKNWNQNWRSSSWVFKEIAEIRYYVRSLCGSQLRRWKRNHVGRLFLFDNNVDSPA